MASASCPSTGRHVDEHAASFECLPLHLAEPRIIIRCRGNQSVALTPVSSSPSPEAYRLLLHPKVTGPDKPVAAHRVVITAASGGNVATDVIDPKQSWYIRPGVLECHQLHLLVNVDGLVQARLPRGLFQQAVDLSLHLSIALAELVPFIFAEIGAVVAFAGRLQGTLHQIG